MKASILPFFLYLALLLAGNSALRAQPLEKGATPTGFNYEGRLFFKGVPANGDFTLRFSLHSSPDADPTLQDVSMRGAWVTNTVYAKGDVVTFKKSDTTHLFFARVPNQKSPPGAEPSFWADLGSPLALTFKGAWDSGTTYQGGDFVTDRTALWFAKGRSTGVTPANEADSVWLLLKAGTQVGNFVTSKVTVNDGAFLAPLQGFGPEAFTGLARWLEVEVATLGNTGQIVSYTTLSPRQELGVVPYALYAFNGVPSARWRGEYSKTNAFSRGDVVSYRGSFWVAQLDQTTNAPAAPDPRGFSNDYWTQSPAQPADGTIIVPYALHALDGAAGPAGPQGPVGPQGSNGVAGVAGPTGPKGDKGDNGAAGTTGAAGPQGPQGLQGVSGVKGDKGDTGAIGPAGPVGPQGVAGAQGPKGDKGDTGTTGAQGIPGVAGPTGPKGDTGAIGVQGPQGIQGVTGLQGPIGLTGAAGPTGSKGDTGASGPAGAKGVNWRGAWNEFGFYELGDAVAHNGASWFNTEPNEGNAPGTAPVVWALLADKGATGPQGPEGTVPANAAKLDVPNVFNGDQTVVAGGLRLLNGNITMDSGTLTVKSGNLNVAGNIKGNGIELFNLRAESLAQGTLDDQRLSANVARRDTANTFAGNQTVAGTVTATSFAGGGGGLTGVNAVFANFAGTAFALRVPEGGGNTDVDADKFARRDVGNTFTGDQTINSGSLNVPNGAVTVGGTVTAVGFAGDGSGLTGVNAATAANFSGPVTDGQLPANVARLNGANTFTGPFAVTTGPGGTVSLADEGFTPALVMTGGGAPGILRVRNSLEIWNGPGGAGAIDVRDLNGAATIGLSGATGHISAVAFDTTSDRNVKENFEPVDPEEVLAKVAALPISRWNFKQDRTPQHIGPMAQDFHAAFGLGTDDKHIATVDADGVALAAIQGLNEKVEERSRKLESENAELKRELAELKALVGKLAGAVNGGGR